MISTTVTINCDVEGCRTMPVVQEGSLQGASLIPDGWAAVTWLRRKITDPGKAGREALEKIARNAPDPKLKKFYEANAEAMGVQQPMEMLVQCRAVICPGCIDKLNLARFDTHGGF